MAKPFDFFELIHCINLPNASERLTQVSNEFTKLDILDRVKFIHATPPIEGISISSPSSKLKFPKGEIGVSLSQSKAIISALNNKSDNVLIFEDDVQFFPHCIPTLHEALQELPKDWDVLYLGGKPTTQMIKVSPNICRVSLFLGAYAYAVSNKFMFTLVSTWLDNLTTRACDGIMKDLSLHHNFYCINPPLCTTREGISIIRDNAFRSYQHETVEKWKQYAPK